MKTLFVVPERTYKYQSLGLGYLREYLTSNGVTADFADLRTIRNRELSCYQWIGVTVHAATAAASVALLRRLKARAGKAKFVCGGPHVTALPQQMLAAGFDHAVCGVGHRAMLRLIRGDTSPIIAGNLSDVADLHRQQFYDQNYKLQQRFALASSFGCPHRCTFCSSPVFWQYRWTPRDAASVGEELRDAIQRRPQLRRVSFVDDYLLVRRAHADAICREMTAFVTAYPQCFWTCMTRPEQLDAEICQQLAAAGCRQVYLGIESTDATVLRRAGKLAAPRIQRRAIDLLRAAGIRPYIFLLVGLPGESEKSIAGTAAFIRRYKLRRPQISIAIVQIFPGTQLYQNAIAEGFDPAVYLTSGVPYYTLEQPLTTLKRWYNTLQQCVQG